MKTNGNDLLNAPKKFEEAEKFDGFEVDICDSACGYSDTLIAVLNLPPHTSEGEK